MIGRSSPKEPTATSTTNAVDAAGVFVLDGETPEACCPYCERPFRSVALRALHVGERHAEHCTDAEREAYAEAYESESDALFIFQLKSIAALVALSLGFTYTYAIVWT